jgi:hypothetical protein
VEILNMKIIYTHGQIETTNPKHSVFLAGPTPRSDDVKSWRPEAIELLRKNNYDGVVYSPEHPDGQEAWKKLPYPAEWEHQAIRSCGILLFWVPRNMENMPALTTNVEFGHFIPDKYVVYGRPPNTPNMAYLDWMFRKYYNKPIHDSLSEAINEVATTKVMDA